jgi:hypothetical protein
VQAIGDQNSIHLKKTFLLWFGSESYFEISTFSAEQTFPSFADRDSGAVGPAWLTVQKTVRRVLRNVPGENKTRKPVSSRICNIAKISLDQRDCSHAAERKNSNRRSSKM